MKLSVRVYYEDTDCGGVVYYANYLRYLERARTEFLRDSGVSLGRLIETGIVFVVTRVDISFHKPCKYDDMLVIETELAGSTRATIAFSHVIRREGDPAERVKATVELASVNSGNRPVRLPDSVRGALKI